MQKKSSEGSGCMFLVRNWAKTLGKTDLVALLTKQFSWYASSLKLSMNSNVGFIYLFLNINRFENIIEIIRSRIEAFTIFHIRVLNESTCSFSSCSS